MPRRSPQEILEAKARSGTWSLDLRTQEVRWSPGIYLIHGVEPEHFSPDHDSAIDFYTPDSRKRLLAALDAAATRAVPFELELEIRRPDDTICDVITIGEPVLEGDQVIRLVGAFFDNAQQVRDARERRRLLELSAQREAELREAQRLTGMGSWYWDIATDTVTWSESLYAIFGLDPQRPPPTYAQQPAFYDPEGCRQLNLAVSRAISDGTPYMLELKIRHAKGDWRWTLARGEAVTDAAGTVVGLRGTSQDITERKLIEDALRVSEARFAAIFNSMFQFTGLMEPDGTLLEANDAAIAFAGLPREELVGRPFWECYWCQHSPELQRRLKDSAARAAAGEFIRYDVEIQGANGKRMLCDFSLTPVFDAVGQVTLLIPEGRDITDAHRMRQELDRKLQEISLLQESLRDQAARDGLTGLYNRRHFDEYLASRIADATRRQQSFAVLMIDIDHFKHFNDLYGHAAGDYVLQRVALVLRNSVRADEAAFRWGGEEFAVLLSDHEDERTMACAERLRAKIGELALTYNGIALPRVTASIGIATYRRRVADASLLLRDADEALYLAKRDGRDQVRMSREVGREWTPTATAAKA